MFAYQPYSMVNAKDINDEKSWTDMHMMCLSYPVKTAAGVGVELIALEMS